MSLEAGYCKIGSKSHTSDLVPDIDLDLDDFVEVVALHEEYHLSCANSLRHSHVVDIVGKIGEVADCPLGPDSLHRP